MKCHGKSGSCHAWAQRILQSRLTYKGGINNLITSLEQMTILLLNQQ